MISNRFRPKPLWRTWLARNKVEGRNEPACDTVLPPNGFGYYFDGISRGIDSFGSICFLISSTVGNRPSCFLEKINCPSRTMSKIPLSAGFRATVSFLFRGIPYSAKSWFTNSTARGWWPQGWQYVISRSTMVFTLARSISPGRFKSGFMVSCSIPPDFQPDPLGPSRAFERKSSGC